MTDIKVNDIVRVVADRFMDGPPRSGIVTKVGRDYVVTTEKLMLKDFSVEPEGDNAWVFGWKEDDDA